jgi:hypothetical protein
LEVGQEGSVDGTPQPIVADVVEPLGQHMREKAPDALWGGQGHRPPALGLGVLVAEADVVVLEGENPVIRQRDPVDIPAQVVEDLFCALKGRLAVDDPPLGPDGFR